jgi:hypothetical protein
MIKTLRITSIAVVILAGIMLTFPVVFGLRGEEQVEQFLSLPGAIEQFSQGRSDSQQDSSERQISPLIKQAEAFALYLNPPPPKQPAGVSPSRPSIDTTPRPERVSAKFTLVGTSVHPSHPEQSLAFIDEPGKDLQWVRQNSEVGHLIIEQIKDGLIVVRDGQRTFNIPVQQRPMQISLLDDGSGPVSYEDRGITGLPAALSALESIDTGVSTTEAPSRPTAFVPRSRPEIDNEERAALEELVSKLKELHSSLESDKIDPERSPEQEAAMMEKLISDFKQARVSSEEAKKLGDLGNELENGQRDPNQRQQRKLIRPQNTSQPKR